MRKTTKNGYPKFRVIVRMLERLHPDIYDRLVKQNGMTEPAETDLSKIPELYTAYLRKNSLMTEDLDSGRQSGLNRTEKGNARRVFIAAMVQIFSPYSFTMQPPVMFTTGLISTLARSIGIDRVSAWNMTHQIPVWYRTDQEFKQKVDETTKILRDGSA